MALFKKWSSDSKEEAETEIKYLPIGIGFGISLGLMWGVALNNFALGLPIGLVIGVAFGVIFSQTNFHHKSKEKTSITKRRFFNDN